MPWELYKLYHELGHFWDADVDRLETPFSDLDADVPWKSGPSGPRRAPR